MSTRRSSAEPAALSQFATATIDALATLRVKSDTVARSLDTLASAGSDVDLPTSGDLATELSDFVTDWEHLGTFARDVANGFYWLLGEVGYHGGVVTFGDTSLTRLGIVGYADRDEAIAAAEEMAERFRDLRDQGYDGLGPDAVHDLLAMAERGQYDPAFAVAFSEAVGVEGYVDLTAMIRHAYQPGGIYEPVPPAGLDGVEVLANTLTSALATLPGLPPGEGSPATAGWSRGERLDRSFLDDLAGDFDVEEGRYNTDFPVRTDTDLSVLLSLTAPSTSVAVTIANGRLTPLLRDPERLDARAGREGDDWGDHGGRITNYATMLGRDPDASARWLDAEVRGTQNLDLVLRRNPDLNDQLDVDGGRALAQVVEHGVTHHDDDLRAGLMERAIEVIGGDQDEIRNPHLPDALAHGVAQNMDVIDHLVNDGWAAHEAEPPPRATNHTHDFLVEVLRDDSAATAVHRAIEEYSIERLAGLPPEDPTVGLDDRTAGLREVGAIQGVALAAEANVVTDSVEEYAQRREEAADALNLAVGLIPWGEGMVGTANDVGDVYGVSLGELIGDPLLAPEPPGLDDDVRGLTRMVRRDTDVNTTLLLAAAREPDRFAVPVDEMSVEQRRELIGWAYSTEVYDGSDHDSLMAGLSRAMFDFAPSAWER